MTQNAELSSSEMYILLRTNLNNDSNKNVYPILGIFTNFEKLFITLGKKNLVLYCINIKF